MSASSCPDLRFAKGRPHILTKREQKAELKAEDDRQRKLCHVRSGMRCEVKVVTPKPEQSLIVTKRCKGKAVHNHHLIGGVGRRNVGESILAAHRIDCCRDCHTDIEVEILRPEKADDCFDAATVAYVRRRDW